MFHGILRIVDCGYGDDRSLGQLCNIGDAASRNLFCMAAGIVAAILLDFYE